MNKIVKLLKDIPITVRKCDTIKDITQGDRLYLNLFLHSLSKTTLLYRYAGDKYLRGLFNSDTCNIDTLSKHIFLFGDKGHLFYEDKIKKISKSNFSEIEQNTFKYIYDKLYKVYVNTGNLKSTGTKMALLRLSCYDECNKFFSSVTLSNWIEKVSLLNNDDKTIIKHYYLSFLHTVGAAGIDNCSYFLSTSTDYNFCNKLCIEHKEKQNEEGAILVGWTGKQKYIRTFGERNSNHIKKLGFPMINNALFPNQHEITLMCGLLPHFIIGYFYKDKFEINPYVFEIDDLENVMIEGLPVKQDDFMMIMNETNIKLYYNMCDGFYW